MKNKRKKIDVDLVSMLELEAEKYLRELISARNENRSLRSKIVSLTLDVLNARIGHLKKRKAKR